MNERKFVQISRKLKIITHLLNKIKCPFNSMHDLEILSQIKLGYFAYPNPTKYRSIGSRSPQNFLSTSLYPLLPSAAHSLLFQIKCPNQRNNLWSALLVKSLSIPADTVGSEHLCYRRVAPRYIDYK